MKNASRFWEGSKLFFGFQKRGGWGVCAPARALLCAQRQEEASFYLSSFAMRWTVPVPIPSDLATFKIPTPFASCFRTLRSVVLSIFGGQLHALSDGALEACFDPLANHRPLEFSEGACYLENELAHRGRRVDGLLV